MSFTKLLRFAAVGAALITQGTLTAQVPGLSHTATWNNVAVTFIAQTLDVTDTASAAGSLLARWRVGGVDKFVVSKAGAVTAGAASFTTGAFSGDLAIATNKFTVASATGNTAVAGTFLSTGNLTVGASTFVVTAATGAVQIGTGNGGWNARIYTGSVSYSALYSTGVTPSDTNFSLITNIGVVTIINGTTSSALAVNGINVASATETGLDVTGTLSVATKVFAFGANDSASAGFRTVTIANA